ncbi:MAG: hypothetical protein ABI847_11670 [Anaerolineales bacterium]
MSENINRTEPHGCIICGRSYDMLVVYAPDGHMVDCKVLSFGGHRVADPARPLVACDRHASQEIQAAYAQRYPGGPRAEDRENEDE